MLAYLIALLPALHAAPDIEHIIPLTEQAIEQVVDESTTQFRIKLEQFLQIPNSERTFDNTARLWDETFAILQAAKWRLKHLTGIYPEKTLRNAAQKGSEQLESIYLQTLLNHPEIYEACLAVLSNDASMTAEERYCVQEYLEDLRDEGIHLSQDQRALVGQKKQEIDSLTNQFYDHVVEDKRVLEVSREELKGLSPSWISIQNQDEKGHYRLSVDFPTCQAVLSQCENPDVRRKMYALYFNRAYPQNEAVVAQLIAKRDQLAKLLGFSSCVDHELSRTMAGSLEKVETLLQDVKNHTEAAMKERFEKMTKQLPEGVVLSADGKLEGFDERYVTTVYQKTHFAIDRDEVAEYFPMEKTIQGLITIYEHFFSLSIKEVAHSLPIPNLKALEVRDRNSHFLGVIYLDLFPREGKITHNASAFPLLLPFSPSGEPVQPGAAFLVCNFSPPAFERPALMQFNEVVSFFHEFGHTIHYLFGKAPLWWFCGSRVKRDFVEVPSLLLENWVRDPAILKSITSHYLTKESMPDEMLNRLLKADQFNGIIRADGNRRLSLIALAFFGEGEIKDPTALFQLITEAQAPNFLHTNNHYHTSWWHVPAYSAKYYTYLWSEVLACDLFEKIREGGLLNPEVGDAYVKAILSKGGSVDPNELLRAFLGREPSPEPFYQRFLLN